MCSWVFTRLQGNVCYIRSKLTDMCNVVVVKLDKFSQGT